MKKLSILSVLCGAALGLGSVASANAATTLEAVQAKGFIQCGVSQGLPGFSNADDNGKWTGLDVDMCRAVEQLFLEIPVKSNSHLFRLSSVLPL